jgi:putative tryptophan/tyrosine transport system substrate-binding protein
MFALGASLSGHAASLRAQMPASIMRRVGVLAPSTRAREEITLGPFFIKMRELGWIEGQNMIYDRVYADDQMALLTKLAAELVARKPEVIFAPPTPAAVAAKQATQTIPIVFAAVADPVGSALVASLARPGGNVTGISGVFGSLVLKRVELLREILPGARRLGLLSDSNDRLSKLDQQVLAPIAPSLGLTLILVEASNPIEFDAALAKLVAERVDAILPAGTGINFFNMRSRLVELANRARVPVIGHLQPVADAGALFTYAASLDDRVRRAAELVDKLLKGAKPADMAVEQPTLFELAVNLKTAKALGITIPQSILLRADRVIE